MATETVIALGQMAAITGAQRRSALDALDSLQKKSLQLESLLVIFTGDSGESIGRLSRRVQDDLLGIAIDLASDINTLLESVKSVELTQ